MGIIEDGSPFRTRTATSVVIALCVLCGASNVAAQKEQPIRGMITDSMCAGANGHSATLKPGETVAQCVARCVHMGAKYVLLTVDGKAVYQMDNQQMPRSFPGQLVEVIGTLNQDTDTVHVADIVTPLPPKVSQAKSIFIDCDSCVRRMTKANLAAQEELEDWGHFTIATDRRKADLVLLFASNPYLGDYVRRDAPDPRPIRVDVAYMNVIDPQNGRSLWSSYRKWGSLRAAGAAKDMVNEFRAHLDAENGNVARLLLHYNKPDLGENAPTPLTDTRIDIGK
jgi:hypothetical protein